MSEKELVNEIKRTLAKVAETDSSWGLCLGSEKLSAGEVVKRLDNDRKLRKTVLKHYVGLAVEIEAHAREKRFGGEK